MATPKKERGRMYVFLICLVLLIVFNSFITESLIEQLILNFVVLGLFVSVVFVVRQTKRSLVTSLILGLPWMVAVFVDLFVVRDRTLFLIITAAAIPFLIFVTAVVFQHVLRSRRATADTIYGAICVYLLLGIVWAAIYRFLEALSPGSFAGPMGIELETGIEIANYMYFSFTTLTTLGYGDITPLSAPARSIAIMEAIAGPLYITILISQLVAKYVGSRVEKEVEESRE